MPQRIQRRRVKGWRKPENAVYVGRPTLYGNPFTTNMYFLAGYGGSEAVALQHCVDAYRAWMTGKEHHLFWSLEDGLPDPPDIKALRGKNLMCWCPLDHPCHADVLLELANAQTL